jgi:nucleoside-diphosphate-sugar epimerase
MPRVLVTGGSGFLGGTVVDTLLARGYSVVTTVRSTEKAQQMRLDRPHISASQLEYAIVRDIAQLGAFDDAVQQNPALDAVIHTASPFHYRIDDVKRDMLDPAVNGTVGVLQSNKKYAPSVKRVVITSSFASMYNNPNKPIGSTYSEKDWNPVTWETALEPENAAGQSGYRTSKALAEKAAWEFMEKEKPGFSLTAINPPLIFGPVAATTSSVEGMNTSNVRFVEFITGKVKEKCPPTGTLFWVDVRDVALAHVLAIEKDAAAGQRYFVAADPFSNVDLVNIISESFPKYKDQLPTGEALKLGKYPEGGPPYKVDNSKSVNELGLNFRTLKESVEDTVKSIERLLEKA